MLHRPAGILFQFGILCLQGDSMALLSSMQLLAQNSCLMLELLDVRQQPPILLRSKYGLPSTLLCGSKSAPLPSPVSRVPSFTWNESKVDDEHINVSSGADLE